MFFALIPSPTRSLRSIVRAGLIAVVLGAVLARPAPSVAQDDTTVTEVYDARDLAVLFAASPGGQPLATEKPDAGATSPFWVRPQAAGGAGVDRLEALFTSILGAVGGVSCKQLVPGVFAVTAERELHPTIRSMLTQLRDLSHQRYELELVVYAVATPSAPTLGAAVTIDPNSGASRTRTTVLRRLARPIEAITRIAYISDWMPVVADNAVGNDPTTSEVVSGLSCFATVGAGPESGETISFQLTGRMCRATVDPAPVGSGKAFAASGPASEGLGIGLPKIDERTIHVDLPLSLGAAGGAGGKLTAVAVLPGFDAGQSLVIAAGVREIK